MEQENQAVALASDKVGCPRVTAYPSLMHILSDEAFGQGLQGSDSAFCQHQVVDHGFVKDGIVEVLDEYICCRSVNTTNIFPILSTITNRELTPGSCLEDVGRHLPGQEDIFVVGPQIVLLAWVNHVVIRKFSDGVFVSFLLLRIPADLAEAV